VQVVQVIVGLVPDERPFLPPPFCNRPLYGLLDAGRLPFYVCRPLAPSVQVARSMDTWTPAAWSTARAAGTAGTLH